MIRSVLLASALFAAGITQTNAAGCSTQPNPLQCLEQQLDALTRQVNNLPPPTPAPAPMPVLSLRNVVIEWAGHDNNCLAIMDGASYPQLRDTCTDSSRQLFNIRQP